MAVPAPSAIGRSQRYHGGFAGWNRVTVSGIVMSALPRRTDIPKQARQVRKVPITELNGLFDYLVAFGSRAACQFPDCPDHQIDQQQNVGEEDDSNEPETKSLESGSMIFVRPVCCETLIWCISRGG
jgi:hypothetical protein